MNDDFAHVVESGRWPEIGRAISERLTDGREGGETKNAFIASESAYYGRNRSYFWRCLKAWEFVSSLSRDMSVDLHSLECLPLSGVDELRSLRRKDYFRFKGVLDQVKNRGISYRKIKLQADTSESRRKFENYGLTGVKLLYRDTNASIKAKVQTSLFQADIVAFASNFEWIDCFELMNADDILSGFKKIDNLRYKLIAARYLFRSTYLITEDAGLDVARNALLEPLSRGGGAIGLLVIRSGGQVDLEIAPGTDGPPGLPTSIRAEIKAKVMRTSASASLGRVDRPRKSR